MENNPFFALGAMMAGNADELSKVTAERDRLREENERYKPIVEESAKLWENLMQFYKMQDDEIKERVELSSHPRDVWESIVDALATDAKQALSGRKE